MKRRRNIFALLAAVTVVLSVLAWRLVVRIDEVYDETDELSMAFDGERATPNLDRSPLPFVLVGGTLAVVFALLAWRNAVRDRALDALVHRHTPPAADSLGDPGGADGSPPADDSVTHR